MSACCSTPSTQGTAKFFSRWAKKYSKQVKKGKLEKVQTVLLECVRSGGVRGATVLDIGCGAGALHLALLDDWASSSVGVDLSPEMIASARSIAEQRGLSDRTTYLTGDVVALGEDVPEADITFMDKVVCCYEDLPALLRTATSRTKRLLALSHPTDNWLMRPIFMTQIFFSKIFRMEFRPWWHDWGRLEEMLSAEGMRLMRRERMLMWTVLVFGKPQG